MTRHTIELLYMLIILDDSLLNVDFENDQRAAFGLEAILCSYMRGSHYVVGNLPLLSNLETASGISKHYVAIIRKIRQSYSVIMSLADNIHFHVRAVDSSLPYNKDGECWNVPVGRFSNISVDPAILICEDLHDVDIYAYSGYHYAISRKMGSLRLNFIGIGGGGGSTPIQYKRAIDKSTHFVLCITDSDFESPFDKTGGITRQRCDRYSKDTAWVTHHYAPKARELENVIPLGLLRATLSEQQNNLLESNLELAFDSKCDLLAYGDFKKGTSLRTIAKYPKGHHSRNFWKTAVTAAVTADKADSDCWVAKSCLSPDECKCNVFHPLGETVSKSALSFLEKNSPQKSFEAAKNSSNIEDWLTIGKFVFDWCCAPSPQVG